MGLCYSLFFCFSFFYSCSAWSQTIHFKQKIIAAEQKSYPIENKKINESSGLACSSRDKHILWTHNDSGHMPIIYAMDDKGKDLATFHLDEIDANDWEDMDAFKYQGKAYLLLADTGDNFRLRFDYQIYIIAEPSLKERSQSVISPAWSFDFEFEDGKSYDVESAAVDVSSEKIILLTKRTPHALMFELPLKPQDLDKTQIALKTGEFKNIEKASALDISDDGQLMSINTYSRIHRFHRNPLYGKNQKNNWIYDYSLSYKYLFQPEAMCLAKNKKNYYVSSEKKAKLLKIKINQ